MPLRLQKWTIQIRMFSKHPNFLKSVELKNIYGLAQVSDISENPGNPRKFVSKSQGFPQKLSGIIEFRENFKKFFWLSFFSFDDADLSFWVLKINAIWHGQNFSDFRFFDFETIFGAIFTLHPLENHTKSMFFVFWAYKIKNHSKNSFKIEKSKIRKFLTISNCIYF